jgi:D-sedoheptulose 7-phosphate isomerase
MMRQIILDILAESLSVKDRSIRNQLDALSRAAETLAGCITSGHKILIFGNGGSAADAQHIAAEFVNRFRIERPPLPVIALTTDTSILTSIGNDYDFVQIFSKQVRALGKADDVAWGISTSGNSPNVLAGIEAARQLDMATLGMTGRGGKLHESVKLSFTVDSDVTARIQETHITIGHILCELVDRILFPQQFA